MKHGENKGKIERVVGDVLSYSKVQYQNAELRDSHDKLYIGDQFINEAPIYRTGLFLMCLGPLTLPQQWAMYSIAEFLLFDNDE